MRFLLTAVLIITSISLYSQQTRYINESTIDSTAGHVYKINDSVSYLYKKPVPFTFVLHAGEDMYLGTKNIFRKESILPIIGITASTLLFIKYDDQIIDASKRFGNYIGVPGTNNAKNISPVKNLSFFVPTDLSSGLYYIGDGITEIAVDGGFYLYGLIKNDYRALKTASELSEGLIAMGVTVQILKHLSGRESPKYATASAGRWDWFPKISEYQKHVPHYDAFPSGHLATAMMTTTIISSNYPEYKFIKPLCFTLMGLCGFQMMNNGVHWMSDYPLAIAIGYSFGKIAVARGRLQILKNKSDNSDTGFIENKRSFIKSFNIRPAYLGYGATGLNMSLTF
jgi:hypothetical protein